MNCTTKNNGNLKIEEYSLIPGIDKFSIRFNDYLNIVNHLINKRLEKLVVTSSHNIFQLLSYNSIELNLLMFDRTDNWLTNVINRFPIQNDNGELLPKTQLLLGRYRNYSYIIS